VDGLRWRVTGREKKQMGVAVPGAAGASVVLPAPGLAVLVAGPVVMEVGIESAFQKTPKIAKNCCNNYCAKPFTTCSSRSRDVLRQDKKKS
jgi:hypothetical protein